MNEDAVKTPGEWNKTGSGMALLGGKHSATLEHTKD